MTSMAFEITGAELDEFLRTNGHLRLATFSENGWPHVAPLAYVRLDDSTTLFVRTHTYDRKSENIYHDNRVCVVIDETGIDYTDLRGVFMHAYATLVRDEDRIATLDEAYNDKHYDGSPSKALRRTHALRDAFVWFELDPVNTVTWDNTQLDPDRLPKVSPDDEVHSYVFPDNAGAAEPDSV